MQYTPAFCVSQGQRASCNLKVLMGVSRDSTALTRLMHPLLSQQETGRMRSDQGGVALYQTLPNQNRKRMNWTGMPACLFTGSRKKRRMPWMICLYTYCARHTDSSVICAVKRQ